MQMGQVKIVERCSRDALLSVKAEQEEKEKEEALSHFLLSASPSPPRFLLEIMEDHPAPSHAAPQFEEEVISS